MAWAHAALLHRSLWLSAAPPNKAAAGVRPLPPESRARGHRRPLDAASAAPRAPAGAGGRRSFTAGDGYAQSPPVLAAHDLCDLGVRLLIVTGGHQGDAPADGLGPRVQRLLRPLACVLLFGGGVLWCACMCACMHVRWGLCVGGELQTRFLGLLPACYAHSAGKRGKTVLSRLTACKRATGRQAAN